MHGELRKVRCDLCWRGREWEGDLDTETVCPFCDRAGGMRPDIVWFGEIPKFMERIGKALDRAGMFAAIGTSGHVYPAAGFVHEAGLNGAHTIELNLEPSEVGSQFDEKRYGPASLLVPAYVDELLEACGIHQPRQVEGHNWMEMRGP